ncbi:MAG: PBP1A family penicillin-binding protein [Ignavibacteriota bacterium]|nr:PBP1A family penicillin-binding protein [Ignavibacteriales bacterium]MBL1123919.1 PBP1A family penicillin-binding protein [Ignavibacteriota bacterium]MCC7095183.1 PBP1A family penicillin-binding protein [Ignavibacteriaceae bacterium]QKJ97817.1 MAG: PBP1A family penicillin-binding protein [Ignavibacteriota bacterium]
MKSTNNKKKTWLIAGAVILVLLGSLIAFIFSGLPSLEELENPKPQLASKVFTADGELLGQFFIENRIETHINKLPDYLIKALVATEDRKFYDHWGVDVTRFIKAMIKNIFSLSLAEGASTITQQLARNLYDLKVTHESQFDKAIRKVREWLTAVQIEKNFTKNEIIELYLNVSYFGRSAYGIEAASRVYFGKSASELTLPEAALFVALLKSPRDFDPVNRYDNALQRRNLVMYNMVSVGFLDKNEYDKLKEEPITLASEKPSVMRTIAPHYLEYIRIQMSEIADKHGFDLYRDGLNIYTSIDSRMQKIANEVAAKHIQDYQKIFDKNWNWNRNKDLLSELVDNAIKKTNEYKNAGTSKDKAAIYNRLKKDEGFIDSVKSVATKIEVGFVVIDPFTGQIKAMVGGTNQDFGRGLNHVTGIKRQPGSSFKPMVYATAIENGYFPAYTILNQKFDYNGWSPSNSDNEYTAYETMRYSLALSLNVVTGRMTISDIAPPKQVVQIAKRMGIESKIDPYPAIALGTSEVTPLEMTSAFGTFVNEGIHVQPISIIKVEDKNGILVEQFVPEYVQAISPQTASIMQSMMSDVVSYGTGAGVRRFYQYPAAGKTGTTQNFSDAWFVGYTPELVAGCWVGFDDHRVKFTDWYGQGARAALPIWAMFMEAAYKDIKIPVGYFNSVEGIDTIAFCKKTMELGDTRVANQYCPELVYDIVNSKNVPMTCEIHTDKNVIIKEERTGETGW